MIGWRYMSIIRNNSKIKIFRESERMFTVEGWKLGQLVAQTLPKKKLKRKRDDNEEIATVDKTNPVQGARKNPFSMKDEPGTKTSSKLDSYSKLPKEKAIGLEIDESVELKQPDSSKPSKIRAQKKAAKKAERRRQKSQTDISVEGPSVDDLASTKQQRPSEIAQTKLTPLQQKMREKLTGSQFRHINEKLYTTDSSEALTLFTEQPSLFHDVSPKILKY
jgi:ribosomal RNA-processing protein 8